MGIFIPTIEDRIHTQVQNQEKRECNSIFIHTYIFFDYCQIRLAQAKKELMICYLATRCHFTSVSAELFVVTNKHMVSLASSHYVNVCARV
jgi:hypothetical protein